MIVQRISWRDVPVIVAVYKTLEGQRAVYFAGANDALDVMHPDRHAAWSRQLVIDLEEVAA